MQVRRNCCTIILILAFLTALGGMAWAQADPANARGIVTDFYRWWGHSRTARDLPQLKGRLTPHLYDLVIRAPKVFLSFLNVQGTAGLKSVGSIDYPIQTRAEVVAYLAAARGVRLPDRVHMLVVVEHSTNGWKISNFMYGLSDFESSARRALGIKVENSVHIHTIPGRLRRPAQYHNDTQGSALPLQSTPAPSQGINYKAKVGQVLQRIYGNVTRPWPAPAESVELVVTSLQQNNGRVPFVCTARLAVVATDGRTILWQGQLSHARSGEADGPFDFWADDAGSQVLAVVGDVEGNGHNEVVAQSEGGRGTIVHSVLRWNGSGLTPVHFHEHLEETTPRSGHFVWKSDKSFKQGCARLAFNKLIRPGVCLANFGDIGTTAMATHMKEPFTVKAVADGFVLDDILPNRVGREPTSSSSRVSGQTKAGYLMVDSGRRLLTAADLSGRSARDLTLMRNEIYARHGRIFRDAQLSAYFRAKPWYRESSGYSDAMLSEIERRNTQFILQYQQKNALVW